MSFKTSRIPDNKDDVVAPVVSRSEEVQGIEDTKRRKGVMGTFLSKAEGGMASSNGYGNFFKKLLGE